MSHTFAAFHYHIRWYPSGKLDWERFDLEDAAEQRAEQIQLKDENYFIEQCDEDCDACSFLQKAIAMRMKRAS